MTTKPASDLRLTTVKVGFTQDELAHLDTRRGHYGRAAFLRAAGLDIKLMATPSPAAVTTWAESARIQACFTQINDIAYSLNNTRQVDGVESAAAELLARSSEILEAFKEFRAEILGGPPV
jgi:hypothetical protein